MSALAEHLKWLINSPTEYLKYFEWTKRFEIHGQPQELQRALCLACGRLTDDTEHRSTYRNLTEWYSAKRWCDAGSNSAERLSVEELLEHPYVSLKSNSENMAEMTVSEEQIVNLLKEMKDSTPRTIAKNLKSVLKQR
ncbi:hypothetical protein M3Y98_01190100 [Aphelenchoides besseyi]|nr:hypothetical protein M3Y98_01190100 [Aphelenchoides besseyi]